MDQQPTLDRAHERHSARRFTGEPPTGFGGLDAIRQCTDPFQCGTMVFVPVFAEVLVKVDAALEAAKPSAIHDTKLWMQLVTARSELAYFVRKATSC